MSKNAERTAEYVCHCEAKVINKNCKSSAKLKENKVFSLEDRIFVQYQINKTH